MIINSYVFLSMGLESENTFVVRLYFQEVECPGHTQKNCEYLFNLDRQDAVPDRHSIGKSVNTFMRKCSVIVAHILNNRERQARLYL